MIFLPILLLFGCKEESFTDVAKDVESSTKSVIHDIKNYNFSDAWYNIKTAYNIANKSRYFENQIINVETSRNTQIAGFQSILNECQNFECNVLKKDLVKNLIFPENIVGKIELDISVANAPNFVNSIGKYGNIVRNTYTKDENIEKDLTLFYDALIPLRSALLKTNELLAKDEVYSFERIQELQKYASVLNKKISLLENDIKYLNSLKNKRHITIRIERGYNSTFGFVKSRIQNSLLCITEYIHIVLLLVFTYFIILFIKKISAVIKKKMTEINNAKKAQRLYDKQEYKIPPRF
ncbi:MAG: hypothetical protein IJ638_03630 [Alphaproteobacteria bacterium]|nr:hypothetical protein [Alphaproteobacteria bacterium]